MAQGPSIEIKILGRFAARSGCAPAQIIPISSPRHRALLGYLATQPDGAETRERLATLLWGDRPDKQARQSLRQLLLTLRQELDAAGINPLRIERDSIRLDLASARIDVVTLRRLAASDEPDDCLHLDDLAYGPLLDGVYVESEVFQEWLRDERARLDSVAATAFRRCADAHDRAGRGAQAVLASERLVAIDPLREDAQRVLLALLARYRGRDAALAQGRDLAQLIQREVGASPSAETLALLDRIRAATQDGAERAEAPGEPPARLVGGEETPAGELAAAAAAPPPRRPPLWALTATVASVLLAVTAVGFLVVSGQLRSNAGYQQSTQTEVLEQHCRKLTLGKYGVGTASLPQGEREKLVAECVAALLGNAAAWRSPTILRGPGAAVEAADRVAYGIVVIPFAAANEADGRERRTAERLTDDLINDLSRVPSFRVISRATSRLYAGQPLDVAAVGAELGVRYLVEGAVQLKGDLVRVNFALVDTASRVQIWADRREVTAANLSDAQDEMVRGLARNLHVGAMLAAGERRGPARSGEPEVDELISKGWAGVLRIFELGTSSGADAYFEEALRRKPGNTSAMLGLAGYKIGNAAQFLFPEPEPHLRDAQALVRQVLSANPRSHMGNYYQAVLHKLRGNSEGALSHFTAVLDLNPSFAPAHANVGHVISRAGRHSEALDHLRYAIRLSPGDPSLGNWSLFLGETELERGRDRAAHEWIGRAADLHPRTPFNHAALAASFALKADWEGARKHAALTRDLAPWLTLDVMLQRLNATAAKGAEPQRLVEGLRRAFAASGAY